MDNTDMKIICITGHSGVGKSTVEGILRKNHLNVESINVDLFMFDSVETCQEKHKEKSVSNWIL